MKREIKCEKWMERDEWMEINEWEMNEENKWNYMNGYCFAGRFASSQRRKQEVRFYIFY